MRAQPGRPDHFAVKVHEHGQRSVHGTRDAGARPQCRPESSRWTRRDWLEGSVTGDDVGAQMQRGAG
jgi:hypothetical protein